MRSYAFAAAYWTLSVSYALAATFLALLPGRKPVTWAIRRYSRRMLQAKRVRCLLFEFGQTTFDLGYRPEEIEAFLRSVGYQVRNLVRGDPPFPGGSRVETAQFSMHIAVPE